MAELDNVEEVIRLLRTHKCANEQLDSDTPIDQLEIDSIRLTGFVMDLEEEYDILVTDEEFKKWMKVNDIAEYIERYQDEYGSGDLREM